MQFRAHPGTATVLERTEVAMRTALPVALNDAADAGSSGRAAHRRATVTRQVHRRPKGAHRPRQPVRFPLEPVGWIAQLEHLAGTVDRAASLLQHMDQFMSEHPLPGGRGRIVLATAEDHPRPGSERPRL